MVAWARAAALFGPLSEPADLVGPVYSAFPSHLFDDYLTTSALLKALTRYGLPERLASLAFS